jgi:tetratricopeptide (TPR) repeat protein
MNGRSVTSNWKWWLIGLTVILLSGAAAGIFFWPVPRPIPEIPLEALDREVADAVAVARAELLANPRSANAWGGLGRVLLANEIRLDDALACFQEAARLDPRNPRWPYFSAGILLVDKGQPEEAVVHLERAVALEQDNPTAPVAPRLLLAETLLLLGDEEQAQGHYYTVLKADPDNPRAHYGLGQLASAQGDWELSRTHLEQCLNSPEARQKAAAKLATVCERLGDKEGAARYASFASRMPKDFDWHDPYVAEHAQLAVRKRDRYRTVENLEAQGEFGKAASVLSRLVEENPDDYLPHVMLGRILPQMGQLEKGEQHLLRARKLAPDKIQINYLLSLVNFNRGEAISRQPDGDQERAKAFFEAAAESARDVLEQKPDYGFAHMSLGLALKQLGQPAESLAALRKAAHCNPEYADIHLFLGEALAEAGEVAEARFHLQQAQLLANPNDQRPKAALDKLPADGDPPADP